MIQFGRTRVDGTVPYVSLLSSCWTTYVYVFPALGISTRLMLKHHGDPAWRLHRTDTTDIALTGRCNGLSDYMRSLVLPSYCTSGMPSRDRV